MKNKIMKIAFVGCLATIGMISCNNSPKEKEEKVEEARANLAKANQNLEQARKDSATDYLKFKEASEAKISSNELKISAIKAEMTKEKKEIRAKYEKQLSELEEKNTKLKEKMQEYSEAGKNKWEDFKLSFNKELDELGISISEMAEKNMKKK